MSGKSAGEMMKNIFDVKDPRSAWDLRELLLSKTNEQKIRSKKLKYFEQNK